MDKENKSQPLEIYDMSVNNPSAQGFLEKSAFLKFLIQQIRQLLDETGRVKGNVSKYNSFVNQMNRVRTEMFRDKKQFNEHILEFKALLEEINQRKRQITQAIMQLTRDRGQGTIDQDEYHHKKYEMEMKRKSLGNQAQILNKNISIYNNLLNLAINPDVFEPVEEEYEAVEEESPETEEGLSDDELLLDNTSDGITYMGVLSAEDIEKAIAKKTDPAKPKDALTGSEQDDGSRLEPRLNIITETGKQFFYTLSPDHTVRIGRSAETDIQIPSPAVSRVHAEILHENGAFYIVDLESSNGTFVNDKMVIRRRLELNDTICIGGTRLIFLT
ncbi:FHA domain-containing protein [bacterium]|nr:FHA domain-containing protein [bacterium]